MRGLLIAVGIVLVAVLIVAALLAVSTGRAYVFTFGAGYPNRAGGAGAIAEGALWVSLALGVALHAAANLYPRRYYHLMWWRDLAFIVAATSVLFAALLVVWRQLEYGAF